MNYKNFGRLVKHTEYPFKIPEVMICETDDASYVLVYSLNRLIAEPNNFIFL